MIILFEELTPYISLHVEEMLKRNQNLVHIMAGLLLLNHQIIKKKQSNVGNSQCHVYHINQPPVITIFVYRCYGYHSRSWLVYGIVLPTLFHLLLL